MPSSDFPVSAITDPLRVSGKFFRAGSEVVMIRAVTFGPFPAGAFPDEGRAQLGRIRDQLGANALRLYEIPSLEFMHACAGAGLRVFITIPWSQHVDFLSERSALAAADQLLIETVERFRGHPALGGYFVGNEIETTLVRWMGAARVVAQIERLIDLGHASDPGTLFAYANYPSTEYMLPQNQDFVAFNLYLEDKNSLSSYLARLQNLAGDKPLFISEFGADARTHGELGQAGILEWYLESGGAAGVAGSTIFAWSDLWQRGGATVEDWEFGLTRRDHSTRPAVDVVREAWGQWNTPADGIILAETPLVTVIVCTYKGSATLVECLDSLLALEYPSVELILVNDGADIRVEELARAYEAIRYLAVEHGGLSSARNAGAAVARGEILVYTDDDCIAEPDWLKWIVKLFSEDPMIGAVGGPNIPPQAETATQARVAAAPGGPVHVLLSDTRAEHLPG
ncbi:MAG: glycosyltransferase, partial [Verrucomicrobiales bacterium]|nr:glycosyltransferase [Verrucomicrobiales bacterium]